MKIIISYSLSYPLHVWPTRAETQFENIQTTFKYNLEFINNKHYSIRAPQSDDNDDGTNDVNDDENDDIGINADRRPIVPSGDGWWWPSMWWPTTDNRPTQKLLRTDEHARRTASSVKRAAKGKVIDEQITGTLGETYEICRPCTDVEMAHAYCSSDIGENFFFILAL